MRQFIKPIAAGLAAVLVLSGCVTTRDYSQMTPAERKMREQADVYNQTVAEGAVLGCLVGIGIGVLASSRSNRGQNALIGCGAGAVVGGGAGAYIANKQESYATREQQLDAMIADVRTENERLASLVTTTRQVIADDKARIDQIDGDLAAGKITLAQAKTKMASVDDNTAYLDNTLTELRKRQQTYVDAAAQTQSGSAKQNAAMQAEIATLETQIAQLQSERDALVQRRTVSRVG